MNPPYTPSDQVIAMFSFLVGKDINYNPTDVTKFCSEINKEHPDIFDFTYNSSRPNSTSDVVDFALERMKSFYFEWGNDPDRVKVKNNCKTFIERDNSFDDGQLRQLEDAANLFSAKYECGT